MYTANLSANMTTSYRNEVTAQGKKVIREIYLLVNVSLGFPIIFKNDF